MLKIDFHTHIISENFLDMASKYNDNRWPIIEKTCECGANIMVEEKKFREITINTWDIDKRIEDMDKEGIDIQVLSPIAVTFSYWADPEKALELAQFQNEFISSTVQKNPKRFLGLATVPMQNVDLAIKEMMRSVNELGLNGVQIGSNINGKNLDHPSLEKFFEVANDKEIPIFIHPWETLGRDRFPRHNFMYTIGMPSETALAAGSVIMSGMLEKYPNLRLCFAHGGGSLPYLLPRMDKGWEAWPHIRKTTKPPTDYASHLYYDSLVYDENNLQFMINKLGVNQIITGSDYPFLLRETPSGNVVHQSINLNNKEKEKIFGLNALRFLNIKDFNINS